MLDFWLKYSLLCKGHMFILFLRLKKLGVGTEFYQVHF